MVTQFHTLSHFVALSTTDLSPTAALAASIRIQGVSKSHKSVIYPLYTHTHNPLQRGHSLLDAYHCGDSTSIHPHLREPLAYYPG